jgi:hypothetical protein
MAQAHTLGPARSSNDLARERDARVCWLLEQHPVTADMLLRLGLFPNRAKALKRLRRLAEKKQVRLVGMVSRKAGRPEHVWCRWTPAAQHLLHEVELTELCLRLFASEIRRGPHVADHHVLPDAEIRINGELYYLELDRGSMSYAQLERQRFRKYEGCPHLTLWVCPTETRLEGMRRRAERLRATALFTTFAEALASPHGEVWRDVSGDRAALPRHCG